MTAAHPRSLVRALTGLVLAASLLATSASPAAALDTGNLLKNPNAELAPTGSIGNDVDVPLWDDREKSTTGQYGGNRFFPTNTSPGPATRGKAFFYGGPGPDADLVQEIDISQYVTKIKTGTVKVNAVAWLGGISDVNDRCDFEVRLVNQEDNLIKAVYLTGPTAAERGNQTKLVKRAKTVLVPKLTRLMGVSITCDGGTTSPNTGIADNLVVKFLNV